MKKSKLTILALTSASIAALAGLGSCSSTSSTIDLTVDTRGTTISFWTGFGATMTDYLDQILEEFTAETGITVEHESKGGYDNLQSAINLSASTMTYPNVCLGYPDHFAGYISSDIQLRLDEFIEQDKNIPETRTGSVTDPSDSSSTFTELDPIDMDDFYSSYLTEVQTLEYKEDGTGYTMGLPFNKSTEVMVYNSTFFTAAEAAGKSSTIYVPETWDQVGEVSEAIVSWLEENSAFSSKILGADGNFYASSSAVPSGTLIALDLTKVAKSSFHPLSYDSTANLFITGVRQWGGTYTTVDKETRKGYIHFQDGDYTTKFLTKTSQLYSSGYFAIPATYDESNYCSTPYKAFKSVMNIGSSAGVTNSVPTNSGTSAFVSECAHVPYKDENNKYVISQGTNLGILDKGTTEQLAASWKLVKYLSQIKNGEWAALSGYFPSCESATNSTEYQEFLSKQSSANDKINVSAAKVNMNVYDADGSTWTKFVDPGFTGSSTIRTYVGTIPAQVYVDGTSISSVISTAVSSLSDYVESSAE